MGEGGEGIFAIPVSCADRLLGRKLAASMIRNTMNPLRSAKIAA